MVSKCRATRLSAFVLSAVLSINRSNSSRTQFEHILVAASAASRRFPC